MLLGPPNGEIRPLVTDGPVGFDKYPLWFQDYRQIADHLKKNLQDILQIDRGKPKDTNMT